MTTLTKNMILAGDCTMTIDTPENGHRTYRVTHQPASGRWKECWFVKLLTGSDNENSYSYVGKLDDYTGQLQLTKASKLDKDAYAVKLLNRVLARVWADDHDAFTSKGFTLHHEGKCCRCGRKLTTPASIELGIGPDCAEQMGITHTVTKGWCEQSEIEQGADLEHAAQGDRDADIYDRLEEKAEFAKLEAEQERQAFASDPDMRLAIADAMIDAPVYDRYGRQIPPGWGS